ncbi:SPOR domain-containing protein [Thioflexithrix psekupsensis]|nr:SPOR domain-containing protein [Thioflexithrix psekupsensis]
MWVVLLGFGVPAYADDTESTAEEWYVILGSFPLNDKGLVGATKLRDKLFAKGFEAEEIILGDSNFYEGLTANLYVVISRPFSVRAEANAWSKQDDIRAVVPDAYVKKAKANPDLVR